MGRNPMSYAREKEVLELSEIVACLDKWFNGDGSDNEELAKAHEFYRQEFYKAIRSLNLTNGISE